MYLSHLHGENPIYREKQITTPQILVPFVNFFGMQRQGDIYTYIWLAQGHSLWQTRPGFDLWLSDHRFNALANCAIMTCSAKILSMTHLSIAYFKNQSRILPVWHTIATCRHSSGSRRHHHFDNFAGRCLKMVQSVDRVPTIRVNLWSLLDTTSVD